MEHCAILRGNWLRNPFQLANQLQAIFGFPVQNSGENRMSGQETAETLALQALGWLAEDAERLSAFMAATGASPGDLAAQAANATFLGSVLDFLLGEDRLVIGFCDANRLPYTAPLQARQALPGGASWHWT